MVNLNIQKGLDEMRMKLEQGRNFQIQEKNRNALIDRFAYDITIQRVKKS